MNKIFIIFCLFGLKSLTCHCQTNATVTYEYHSFGGFEMEAYLVVNDNLSWYSRHQQSTEWTKNGINFTYPKNFLDWYYDANSKKSFEIKSSEGYPTLYAEGTPKIQWNILEETNTIDGFKVQKAICKPLLNSNYIGDVIAWFTTDLPFSLGPERYHGLPGLILKLEYSEMKSMYVLMKQISFDENEQIQIPEQRGVKVSLNEIVNPDIIDKKWLKEQKKLID